MIMIKELIGLLGGIIFLGCCLVSIFYLMILIEAKITKNDDLLKTTLKLLFTTLLIGMVGFGTCSALFELKLG